MEEMLVSDTVSDGAVMVPLRSSGSIPDSLEC
jgi:hypothetical protein